MNTFYTAIPVVACIIELAVGIFILSIDPKLRRNRLFFIVSISLALWAAGEFVMRSTTDPGVGMLAGRLGAFGWCLVGAFFVDLCLSLITPPAWWRKYYMWTIYLVSLAFLGLTLFTGLVFKSFEPAEQTGVHEVPGVLRIPSKIWTIGLFILGIAILFAAWKKMQSHDERARVQYVMFAALIPLALGFVVDFILPLFGVQTPISSQAASPIMALIIAFGVSREGLLTTVTGKLGAGIIENIEDAVFLIDPDGLIETVNPAAASITGRTSEELTGTPIEKVLMGYTVPGPSAPSIQSARVFVMNRASFAIPARMTSGDVRNRKDRILGFILVVHDMREAIRLLDRSLRDNPERLQVLPIRTRIHRGRGCKTPPLST